jgi:hypothetical protein
MFFSYQFGECYAPPLSPAQNAQLGVVWGATQCFQAALDLSIVQQVEGGPNGRGEDYYRLARAYKSFYNV